MPPPNQRTVWPASGPSVGVAESMRTFMCTVGTYGLRGWKTSDTPMASNGAPASSGRCCVADVGSAVPRTCENAQPPRSSKPPLSISRVMPAPSSLPPGGRSQASVMNACPSSAPTASQIDCCRPSR